MKHLLILLSAVALMTFSRPATAQVYRPDRANDKTNYQDTALGNATLHNIFKTESQGGTTLQYAFDNITDTTTGYASLWGSVDGNDYFPMPGADSVAITAHAPVRKGWFVCATVTGPDDNPIRFIDVRTRLVSNTTNASSKGYVRTRLYRY